MYSLTSNNVKHDLLEKSDVGIELISYLNPYNRLSESLPVDNNFISFGDIEVFKNKYDLLMLCLYFTDAGYGPNKILATTLYPVIQFQDAPIETNYKQIGLLSVDYISADSKTAGTALKYEVSILKTASNKVLAQTTHNDLKGILYGIKL